MKISDMVIGQIYRDPNDYDADITFRFITKTSEGHAVCEVLDCDKYSDIAAYDNTDVANFEPVIGADEIFFLITPKGEHRKWVTSRATADSVKTASESVVRYVREDLCSQQ